MSTISKEEYKELNNKLAKVETRLLIGSERYHIISKAYDNVHAYIELTVRIKE